MKLKKIIISTSVLLTTLIFIGCSKNSNDVMSPDQTGSFTTSPTDLAQSVRLDEKIVLSFAKPVDAKIVENNFHLISQRDMADSTCPTSKSMNHGDMNMTMGDTAKMNHMDAKHSMSGKFSWNSTFTKCTFTPDSMMVPKMQYMMHVGKDMVSMMNQKMGDMGNMGGMMGSNSGTQMSGHMLMHFTTMDTATTTGGGHLGHH